jgi:hypothetical protein
MDRLVYSGVWASEGHYITFTINDNDTVTIQEDLTAAFKSTSTHKIVDIDTAIEYQEKHIRLGYDKIS